MYKRVFKKSQEFFKVLKGRSSLIFFRSFGMIIFFWVFVRALLASEDIIDQYPQSALYQKPVEVIPGVFTAIGATAPPTYENTGHNNNLSFIVTGEGVVVINAGATDILAKAFHEEIMKVTDQIVVLVINENGQGHAMLGNGYWVDQGVTVISHADAAEEFEDLGHDILQNMRNYNKEKAANTRIQLPTKTFEESFRITIGHFEIEILFLGPAHSPGDISVWLPNESLIISGDIAFHERMLPIFPNTSITDWIKTWDNELEPLKATYVIPGHGHPTNMAQVRRYTRDYLLHLRAVVGELLEAGGELKDAYYVDQSKFKKLDTFEQLAKRNAGMVFQQMEFE